MSTTTTYPSNPSSSSDSASASSPPILFLFDLDGTLYDQKCGYVDNVHNNIFEFMVQAKGDKFDSITTIEKAKKVWTPIFQKYNLTKRGLLGEGYEFDSHEYDQFIRKDPSKFITGPDRELREFLLSLPSRIPKVIFTNAPEFSAHEILKILGGEDLFEHVLGSDFLQDKVCKPEQEAFELVLRFLKIQQKDYGRIWFFEDSYTNLAASKQLFGMKTCFVKSSKTIEDEGAQSKSSLNLEQFDAIIEGKVGIELKEQIPELWDAV